MDCGKAVAACVARPGKQVAQLQGVLKVGHRNRIPQMWAVPTTSGTGSEATMAAVITDHETHRKKSINDIAIMPHTCVLDPLLTAGLPPEITANTGMDALCHAVKAYTNGTYNTRVEKDMAKKVSQAGGGSLYEAYRDGSNMKARENICNTQRFTPAELSPGVVWDMYMPSDILWTLQRTSRQSDGRDTASCAGCFRRFRRQTAGRADGRHRYQEPR